MWRDRNRLRRKLEEALQHPTETHLFGAIDTILQDFPEESPPFAEDNWDYQLDEAVTVPPLLESVSPEMDTPDDMVFIRGAETRGEAIKEDL